MESAAAGLLAIVLKLENLVLVVAVALLLSTLRRVVPELYRKRLFVRLLPLVPLALCFAGLWIPWVDAPEGFGARALLGVLLGAAVGQAHKILRQTGLGLDERLVVDAVEPLPAVAADPEKTPVPGAPLTDKSTGPEPML